MPRQRLPSLTQRFARDVVLGIFNPALMTTMMQSTLLPIEDDGHVFDDMRHNFTYHEFVSPILPARI
jgi:hypothetical protein